ncbi:MAG: hypothetical protein IJB43_09730 [Clostridia bacterium]|nr:hypothetical protein [Clostridia bacterium]
MKINFERIRYSPFGKRITNRFKGSIIMNAMMLPLMVFLSLIFFAPSVWLGICMIPITVGVPIFLIYASTKEALLGAEILSAMTDEEHNKLVLEYKKYEERNIIRYGHLTSYGLILNANILPWGNIKAIEFVPGEYRYVYRKYGSHMKYYPAKIKVTLLFGAKKITETKSLDNEDYDLSDEIALFLESIPKYTEHKFEVTNGYYYAK